MTDQAGGFDELKNRSRKCEGSGEGGRRGKELELEMRRTGGGGGTNGCLKRKVFLKTKNMNQKLLK